MSNAVTTDARQERGVALAKAKGKRIKSISDGKYLVPSATENAGGYVVDVAAGQCSCPDYEARSLPCKHLFAVEYIRQETTTADGATVVTEAVRVTYTQDWPAYNRAQCEEKERVQILLRGLCDGIEQPTQSKGRPRLPLGDAIYCATMKVYGTMSGRRSTTDLRACEAGGLVERAAHYNSVFRYMERADLMPLLSALVDESAKPLRAIEHQFAADATGFATQTYVRWFDYRYGEDKRAQRWVKLHAMVGTLTNVVTTATVTESNVNDSPMFAGLVERSAANGFDMREVSADKAYLGHANLAVVEKVGGQAFVPFKSNSGGTGSAAWERLWHLYSLNREDFLAHYHRRSNVESTFSAIKRKFGENVRSKLPAAQFNEVLLKCLCHNLTVLVHSIHELGIEPKFWQPAEKAVGA
jgi:transposase